METKNMVIDILKHYNEKKQKLSQLIYELEHPRYLSTGEMLGAMAFSRGNGDGHGAAHISDRTMHIAMNYKGRANAFNQESMDDVLEELTPLEYEVDRLEHYIGLLEQRQSTVIRRYYFEMEPWEQIATDMGVTQKTVQNIRRNAVDQLTKMYEFSDSVQKKELECL